MADATRTDGNAFGRAKSLGRNAFGRASEEPYQRRPADGVVLVLGTLVFVLAAFHSGDPGSLERSIQQLVNELPASLDGVFTACLRLGALWAIGLVVVAALFARRWRLGPVAALLARRHPLE